MLKLKMNCENDPKYIVSLTGRYDVNLKSKGQRRRKKIKQNFQVGGVQS